MRNELLSEAETGEYGGCDSLNTQREPDQMKAEVKHGMLNLKVS